MIISIIHYYAMIFFCFASQENNDFDLIAFLWLIKIIQIIISFSFIVMPIVSIQLLYLSKVISIQDADRLCEFGS